MSHRLSQTFLIWATILAVSLPFHTKGGSVQPTPPSVPYTNNVSFDFVHDTFAFTYNGSDGTLAYNYTPAANGTNGSFNALQCTVNGTNTFYPSFYGGPSLWTGTNEVHAWDAGVSFALLSASSTGNTLTTQWKMSNGTTNLTYSYQWQISGRTLTIQVTNYTGASAAIYLDRCENVVNPVSIHVPYLTTMNVLYNRGAFCSMFFDWENTGASTLYPLDSVFSPSSIYYAQQAIYFGRSDGSHNPVNEAVYLTVSPSLPDVLPDVLNPPSPYKSLVSHYLVFDNWESPFSSVGSQVQSLYNGGLTNVWTIVHNWQNGGYDNKYPNVMPALASAGGDAGLKALSQIVRTNGGLFSLHENYVDFYTNAAVWNPASVALNSDGSLKTAWFNPSTLIQSFEMKPTLAASYSAIFTPQIHSNYTTTACFLDVHSAVNPSDKVDYDASVAGSGTFLQTLTLYRALFAQLRSYHQGPVSGEGNNHLLDLGYIDDVEAQIDTGANYLQPQGSWLPVMPDFELFKLHSKTMTHGVGYYERFYADATNNSQFLNFSRDNALEYMATEIAYGHGGFIPTTSRVYNVVDVGQLEQHYVRPAQMLYANAMPVSILYHDPASNDEVSISDYIRRYPTGFSGSTNANFLSQVRITYDNGVVVCVNRHPAKQWQVQLGRPGGFFDFNAVMNGTNTQWAGKTNLTSYLLPKTNGWVLFAPDLTPPKIQAVSLTNGSVNLVIGSLVPGNSNGVESASDLASNNWQTVSTFISTGTQTNWTVPLEGEARAFYRVVHFW